MQQVGYSAECDDTFRFIALEVGLWTKFDKPLKQWCISRLTVFNVRYKNAVTCSGIILSYIETCTVSLFGVFARTLKSVYFS